MWCKYCLILFLISSCKYIQSESLLQHIDITTKLLTLKYQEEYSIIDTEIKKYFYSNKPKTNKCLLEIDIQKSVTPAGLTSTAFSINQTQNFVVKYNFLCQDGLKIHNFITTEDSITFVQEKTLGMYVGERYVSREISKKAASMIYNKIKLETALYYKK